MSAALAGGFLTTGTNGEVWQLHFFFLNGILQMVVVSFIRG